MNTTPTQQRWTAVREALEDLGRTPFDLEEAKIVRILQRVYDHGASAQDKQTAITGGPVTNQEQAP